jgi:hypothetical protein
VPEPRLGGTPKLAGRPLWGAAVKLALAAEDTEPNKLVWVQVAKSGEWKGHSEGPFTLDRALFEELQKNLRAHVNYRAEPSAGEGRVIQWDFHHACEEHPSLVAVDGAPAQGWIYDAALGDQVPKDQLSDKSREALDAFEAEGVETFWTLTEWLPRAAGYVADGGYMWSSIAIYPNSKDPVTNEDIGWWLSSVALTNKPFIEGMAPLSVAATRLFAAREPKRLSRYYDPWDVPATIGEAFGQLKDILEMGELASIVDVAGELAKLKSYSDGTAPPPGVDVAGLIHKIRQLLQLELLTDTNTIFARCEELLARAAAESQAEPAANLVTTRDSMPDPIDPNKLLLDTIARRLSVPSTPEDVQKAMLARLEEGETAKLQLGEANSRLGQIYQALGVEDYEAAAAQLISSAQRIRDLEALVPEMASLLQGEGETEDEEYEEDMAMAAERLGAEQWTLLGDMVAHARSGGVALDIFDKSKPIEQQLASLTAEQQLAKLTDLRSRLATRKAARAKFRAKFPKPAALPTGQEHLLTSVATRPSGGRGSSASSTLAAVGVDGVLRLASPPAAGAANPGPANVLQPPPPPGNGAPQLAAIRAEVEAHDGPNLGAQCYAYICAKKKAAGAPLNYDDDQAKASILAGQLRGQIPIAS